VVYDCRLVQCPAKGFAVLCCAVLLPRAEQGASREELPKAENCERQELLKVETWEDKRGV
jgi:hypothetical protein